MFGQKGLTFSHPRTQRRPELRFHVSGTAFHQACGIVFFLGGGLIFAVFAMHQNPDRIFGILRLIGPDGARLVWLGLLAMCLWMTVVMVLALRLSLQGPRFLTLGPNELTAPRSLHSATNVRIPYSEIRAIDIRNYGSDKMLKATILGAPGKSVTLHHYAFQDIGTMRQCLSALRDRCLAHGHMR